MATGERAGSVPRSARRAYWRRQVDAHRRSGLSQVAFCAQRGLCKGTLSFWKWKFAREAGLASHRNLTGPARTASAPPFVPVQLAALKSAREMPTPSATLAGVEIELALGSGRGLRVRGRVDAAWLVQVLRGIAAC
jgi:hypothetical protein